jgi:hypothetical protein
MHSSCILTVSLGAALASQSIEFLLHVAHQNHSELCQNNL